MENIAQLRERCQKEKLRANTGMTLMNRKISIYMTWLLLHTKLSASQVTFSSIIIGIIGSFFFIPGVCKLNLIGIFFLYFSFLLDQVDGEIARYYNTPSFNLLYLDELRHLIIYALPVFCLSFPAYKDCNIIFIFLIGFMSSMSLMLSRINERISSLIYTEKVLLRKNIKEINLTRYLDNYNNKKLPQLQKIDLFNNSNRENFRGLLKKSSLIIHRVHNLITNQVTILLCLLVVTVFDSYFNKPLSLSSQTWFFLLFSIIVCVVFLKTVIAWYKENIIQYQCKEINKKLKKYRYV